MQSEPNSSVHLQKYNGDLKSLARIIKYTVGPFNAKGTDVAMEEMVLAYERLVVDDK